MHERNETPETQVSGVLDPLILANVFLVGMLFGAIVQGGVLAWLVQRVIS